MQSDFPATRAAIDRLPAWVNELAATIPQPERVEVPPYGFRWEHPDKTPEVIQVTKAVRLATSLRAALALADLRLTTEAASLLRLAGDFSNEIVFLGEALREGRLTDEQKRFVEQQSVYHPLTAEEFAELERVRYVGRGAAAKALARLFSGTGVDIEDNARRRAYVAAGYDRFIHGKYSTAMELFTGETMTFMLRGTNSPGQVRSAKAAISGKTVEGLQALQIMALTRRMRKLASELVGSVESINTSGEPTL